MEIKIFDDAFDMLIGNRGLQKLDKFEHELNLELLGKAIKKARKIKGMTQEQLGQLVGVKKAQISKVENATTDIRFATILKILNALGAKVKFSVEIDEQKLMISE
ncbi:MAG: helix-turn-helix transcriptional regulator [Saprospiraceae bacterium]|nr:helix-turn-helix transcriptional regulator [Saprospiraceae bacterium]